MGDGHWPSTCNELKWFRQSHGKRDAGEDKEMKTLQWLLSFTKDCPKCGNPIEKNGGCNHMSCSACKYQFCWICLSGWASSHYTCKSRASKDERENLLQHFENNMRCVSDARQALTNSAASSPCT
jgi:ariadne-1